MNKSLKAVGFIAVITVVCCQAVFAGDVSSELKKWHKVTITFDGPQMSENANPNPFMDYRLNVTFTHQSSGKSKIVPGYYAVDGDAANTGADSGNKWRVHFAPDSESWLYRDRDVFDYQQGL